MKRLIAALLLIVVLAMPASAARTSLNDDFCSIYSVQSANYVVDEETGVNYIVIVGAENKFSKPSVSICPRYNADGTLYVTEAK